MLTNSQYELLMRPYYARQIRAKKLLDKRRSHVYETMPEIADIDKNIRELSLKFVTDRLHETSHMTDTEYANKTKELSYKKLSLLKENGYPLNYLEPVYECPDCEDTGYIDDRKCHCLEKAIFEFLYSEPNLDTILRDENFDNFSLEYYPDDYVEDSTGMTPRDNAKRVLDISKEFTDKFDKDHASLLIYGNAGVGKTFLTHCIANEVLSQTHSVVYLSAMKLFHIYEKSQFDKDADFNEKDQILTPILSSDLLIIDDLGTELVNNFSASRLYDCVDTRLVNHRSTIISTNLSFDELNERYSERIFSRIMSSYTILKLTGDDIRIKKRMESLA